MDKLKKKLQSAVSTTKRDVEYMVKHKKLTINKTVEDPEWDEPAANFLKLYESVNTVYNDCKKFLGVLGELGMCMTTVGDDFVALTNDVDPDNIKRIAFAYQDIVHKVPQEMYPEAEGRMMNEILGSIGNKLAEMKPIIDRMELRSSLKMDYDHYLEKVEHLKNKSNVDPNYSIKNQTKLQESQTKLQQCTDELLDKFYAYEAQRPTFLAYEFQTLRSLQKKFFTSLGQAMNGFKITEPSQPPPTNITPLSAIAPTAPGAIETASEPAYGVPAQAAYAQPVQQAPARQAAVAANPFAKATPVDVVPVAAPVRAAPKEVIDPNAVYAEALYDFPGTDTDELPLTRGMKFKVLNQHESGWWTGESKGKTGMFPANYVKLV
ncbi:hypothetical protein WA158_004777 [Blastocystis sp. Blastoise]